MQGHYRGCSGPGRRVKDRRGEQREEIVDMQDIRLFPPQYITHSSRAEGVPGSGQSALKGPHRAASPDRVAVAGKFGNFISAGLQELFFCFKYLIFSAGSGGTVEIMNKKNLHWSAFTSHPCTG
jgi:hypothetical protein